MFVLCWRPVVLISVSESASVRLLLRRRHVVVLALLNRQRQPGLSTSLVGSM
jgi:hypothetical protein